MSGTTPWKERHFLATDPPFDLDALAAEAMTAWNACHTLGCPPDKLEARVQRLVGALEWAEAAMDDLNGDTGTKSRPCSFCRASVYNAEVGIEHAANCPILKARAALAEWRKP